MAGLGLQNTRMWLVDPVTGEPTQEIQGLLSIDTWLNTSDSRPGGGTLTVDIMHFPDEAELLSAKVEFCFTFDGDWSTNTHFELQEAARPIITTDGLPIVQEWGFTSLLERFNEALVWPDGERAIERFFNVNPGALFDDLFDESQALDPPELEEFTKDWGSVNDSRGLPWPVESVAPIWLKPGTTLLDVLRLFEEKQLAEFRIRAHLFRLFVWGTSAHDYSTEGDEDPARQVFLRIGIDIVEGDRNSSGRGLSNSILGVAEDDRWDAAKDDFSIGQYKRRSRAVQLSGVGDEDELNRIVHLEAERFNHAIAYKSVTLLTQDITGAAPLPYLRDSYTVGDYIDAEVGPEFSSQRVRVAAIGFSWARGGVPEITLDLDTRYQRKAERIDQKVDDIAHGVPGGLPPTLKRIPPAPPVGNGPGDALEATTGLEDPDNGPQTAYLNVGPWTLPSRTVDNAIMYDLERIVLKYRKSTGGKWRSIDCDLDTSATITGLPLGTAYDVGVYAIREGVRQWSVPLEGTFTTAAGNGRYRSKDTGGVDQFVIGDNSFMLTKVAGGISSPTGSGVDIRHDRGIRLFGPDGSAAVDLNPITKESLLDGNVYVGGVVEVDGDGAGKSIYAHGSVLVEGVVEIDGDGLGKSIWAHGDVVAEGDVLVTGVVEVDGSGTGKSLWAHGSVLVEGTVEIDGDGVGKSVWAHGDVVAEGSVLVTGTVEIDGSGTGESVWAHGDVAIDGSVDIGGDVLVHGVIDIDGSGTGNSATIHGNVFISGDVSIGGDTTIDDDVTITGELDVTGNSLFSGDVAFGTKFTYDGVTGALALGGDLTANGHTLSGARLTTGTGNIVIDDDTIAVGSNVVSFSADLLNVSDNFAVGGSIVVASTTTLNGTTTVNANADVNGDLTCGNFGANGNAAQGKATLGGAVSGAVGPWQTAMQNLGNALRTMSINNGTGQT